MVLKQLTNRLAEIIINSDDIHVPKGGLTQTKVNSVVEIVFGVLGGVALIMIIMGGINFITSQGDPQKAAKARNTIIYAAIGLAVSISAFVIVTFVIDKL